MIKLRGHHLSLFANNYWNNLENKENLGRPLIGFFYGKEMMDTLDNTWELLRTEQETQVKIVEGLDSICENCEQLDHSCISKEGEEIKEDVFTLKEYGLEVGRIYTSIELIQKITDYLQKTGYKTPRERFNSTSDIDENFYTI